MTSSSNTAADSPQVLLAPSRGLPILDPHVQSFLDRQIETTQHLVATRPETPSTNDRKHFRPEEFNRGNAALLYLHVRGSSENAPDDAVRVIAEAAGALLVLQSLSLEGGYAALDRVIAEALESLRDVTGPGAILLGGDGIGALIAVSFASRAVAAPFSLTLLVLATPLLAWPDSSGGTSWLSLEGAQERALLAQGALDEAGWPIDYRDDRLRRLPPLLILTAEVDPFRRGAEAFARRLMAAEREVSAVRTMGCIHDFTWLPDLLDAHCTKAAHALIVDALRPQTKVPVTEAEGC